jgi:hypothetical protein
MTLKPKKRTGTSNLMVSGGKVQASYTIEGSDPVEGEVPSGQPSLRRGRVHSATSDVLWVTWDRSPRPVAAEVAWLASRPDWSRCAGLPVLLAFADGEGSHPIVVALLEAPPPAQPAAPQPPPTSSLPEILRLESGRELHIECGKSHIHLRADGRIEIRGEYVISRSTGPNKIKGGSVQIN